ncbi:condensation domain-containing protein [Streptomyces avicenniae]|uniref:condensation domain-containing protein n=1 Tax=Streptomyces avicenniae TaxID=500153 RepID=UPI0006999E7E|nr:condensation domain-containing protein [Streptomyces avicenniae]
MHLSALTPPELSLWLDTQFLEADDSSYNIAMAFVAVDIDVDPLRQALQSLVKRHDALRTSFPLLVDRPCRAVIEGHERDIVSAALLHREQVQNLDSAILEARSFALLPFDTESAPLWRFSLTPLGDDRSLLTFVGHHVAFDGQALALLAKDLLATYHGMPAQCSLQPKDLVAAIHAEGEGQDQPDAGSLLASNLARLNSSPPSPSREQGLIGRMQSLLSPDLPTVVRRLATSVGVTPFAVLLGSISAMIASRTRSPHVVLGVPVSLRTNPSLLHVVGHLTVVAPLSLRWQVDTDRFVEVLPRIGDELLDLFTVTERFYGVQQKRSLEESYRLPRRWPTPDFVVGFPPELTSAHTDNALGQEIPLEIPRSRYDLNIQFERPGGTWAISLAFNTSIYREDQLRSWVSGMETILLQAYNSPLSTIEDALVEK